MKKINRAVPVMIIAAVLCGLSGIAPAADEAELEKAAKAAGTWTFGGDAAPINLLAKEVVQAAKDHATKKAIEKHIIAGLAGAKTPASIDFFCRQLVIVGSDAAIPALAKLLGDAESSHMARYALGRLPGPAADRALLDALAKVDDSLKVGMIDTLGRRGCKSAVAPAVKLLAGKNETLAIAALSALSRIDSPQAVDAIAKTRKTASGKIKLAATDAYLSSAKRGTPQQAAIIYTELLGPSQPVMCRIAALNGLASATSGSKTTALLIGTMSDKNPMIRQVAIAALRDVKDPGATKAIANEMTKQDPQTQAVLVNVLSTRGDRSALPIVVKTATEASGPVRTAAIVGLATIGEPSTVGLLATLAVEAKESHDKTAAHNSLISMPAKGVNKAVAACIPRSKPPVRAELIRALGLRQASECMGAVVKSVSDSDSSVRVEAMKSLKALARPEHLPVLVKLMTTTTDDKVRAEAQTTILAATLKIKDGKNPVAALLAADKKVTRPEVKISLFRTMGMIGHDDAIGTLTAGVKNKDAGVKDAAIRAMSLWPSAAPMKTLAEVAADKSSSQTHRILALRGYISMIDKQLSLSDDQIMGDYSKAIALASRLDEKRLVLSKLSGFRSRSALKLAESLSADKDLKRDAEGAVQRIKSLLARPGRVTASHNSGNAKNAIDGDLSTRWDTAGTMTGGEWFKLELDSGRMISGIILDTSGSSMDYPRGYEVYVSAGSIGQGQLVAKGKGDSPITKIKFSKPVRGAIMKIVQTGRSEGKHWSIHELTVLAQ